MLLASCGTSETKAVPITDEAEITDSQGEAKLEAIEENLPTALASKKCVTISDNLESGDFTTTYSGIEMTVSLKETMTAQFDAVDDEYYVYYGTETTASAQGSSATSKTELYSYYFDNQLAVKQVVDLGTGATPMTTRDVTSATMNVGEVYASAIDLLVEYLDTYTWTDVTYYGNSNDYDIRVAATGENGVSLDITFADGVITNFVMTQTFNMSDLTAGQMNGQFTATERATFTYSDSMDISKPDITATDW